MASNALAPKERALSEFTKLSANSSIYRPDDKQPSSSGRAAASSPKLILLLTWMGARDPHIAKYTAKLQALYPASPIVMVKNDQDDYLLFSDIGAKLAPAMPVIRSLLQDGGGGAPSADHPSRPELLLHVFSNGGSTVLSSLYDSYRKTAKPGEATVLPPHVAVFDSCPGQFSWSRSITAFMAPMKGWSRTAALPFVYALLFFWWVQYIPWGREDPIATVARRLNDQALNAHQLRRAYIYSDKDAMVDWRKVEEHAADAKAKGFVVRTEKFVGSMHVAHARFDENRYWRIVKETWEGGK